MLPKAPNPITTARARASSLWPLTPISGRTSCRRYRLGESTRHERMADLWPFARPPLLPGSLRGNRSDAVDCEECAQPDRAPSCGELLRAGDDEQWGSQWIPWCLRYRPRGSRWRTHSPGLRGLHDPDDPHARSRRRESPLLVPDGGLGSRVCPRNCGPHRPPRLRFVLPRSDGADTSAEPDGLTAEPVRRRPRAAPRG